MTNHTLKWEGVWRELGCLARSTSFAVREESGHSLKSALSVPPELFVRCFLWTPLSLTQRCRKKHVSPAFAQSNALLFSTRCQLTPEILPYSPAEVPYCGSARSVASISAKAEVGKLRPAGHMWLAFCKTWRAHLSRAKTQHGYLGKIIAQPCA